MNPIEKATATATATTETNLFIDVVVPPSNHTDATTSKEEASFATEEKLVADEDDYANDYANDYGYDYAVEDIPVLFPEEPDTANNTPSTTSPSTSASTSTSTSPSPSASSTNTLDRSLESLVGAYNGVGIATNLLAASALSLLIAARYFATATQTCCSTGNGCEPLARSISISSSSSLCSVSLPSLQDDTNSVSSSTNAVRSETSSVEDARYEPHNHNNNYYNIQTATSTVITPQDELARENILPDYPCTTSNSNNTTSNKVVNAKHPLVKPRISPAAKKWKDRVLANKEKRIQQQQQQDTDDELRQQHQQQLFRLDIGFVRFKDHASETETEEFSSISTHDDDDDEESSIPPRFAQLVIDPGSMGVRWEPVEAAAPETMLEHGSGSSTPTKSGIPNDVLTMEQSLQQSFAKVVQGMIQTTSPNNDSSNDNDKRRDADVAAAAAAADNGNSDSDGASFVTAGDSVECSTAFDTNHNHHTTAITTINTTAAAATTIPQHRGNRSSSSRSIQSFVTATQKQNEEHDEPLGTTTSTTHVVDTKPPQETDLITTTTDSIMDATDTMKGRIWNWITGRGKFSSPLSSSLAKDVLESSADHEPEIETATASNKAMMKPKRSPLAYNGAVLVVETVCIETILDADSSTPGSVEVVVYYGPATGFSGNSTNDAAAADHVFKYFCCGWWEDASSKTYGWDNYIPSSSMEPSTNQKAADANNTTCDASLCSTQASTNSSSKSISWSLLFGSSTSNNNINNNTKKQPWYVMPALNPENTMDNGNTNELFELHRSEESSGNNDPISNVVSRKAIVKELHRIQQLEIEHGMSHSDRVMEMVLFPAMPLIRNRSEDVVVLD